MRIPRGTIGLTAALVLAAAQPARADLTPPERAEITLELTVDGQSSLPQLKFFVLNCKEPLEESVLDSAGPITCNPKKGPVRIFGFRESDLIEMLAMIRRDAGRDESAQFLRDKAKTCGEVRDQDLNFLAETQVTFVAARYKLEPHGKGGCKLTRVSGTTKTRAEFQRKTEPAPAASEPKVSSKSGPPAPEPAAAPAAKSSCGCRAAPRGPLAAELWALALASFAGLWRRRLRRQDERP